MSLHRSLSAFVVERTQGTGPSNVNNEEYGPRPRPPQSSATMSSLTPFPKDSLQTRLSSAKVKISKITGILYQGEQAPTPPASVISYQEWSDALPEGSLRRCVNLKNQMLSSSCFV
ncbi:hypothetical protein CC86DRAFT_15386 [Ophiobolus disseminans]|uniref:Uncharacterized protein n=1 Tax=Ophiobolus disseminans TaxID=1469910 RepID=A0A6A7AKN6_9PLEO|nr:hypothetical protein CC86DRAFT_15386 [Ophiobolus disseminans]